MSRRRALGLYLFGAGLGVHLVALAGPVAQAIAHHERSAPTRVAVIARVYPDLHARELDRTPVSWAHLRRMAASRWRAQHPAAERRHARIAYRAQLERLVAPYRAALLCIARHEAGPEHGGWRANTGNGYYGGLQMDRTFQRTYAPRLYATKGTADRWTPLEQLAAAARAIPSRGFHPWPNTARRCGLLP